MIQICKLCGSKWEDKKYDHCTQCCGSIWKGCDGKSVKFKTIDDIEFLANTKQVRYEELSDLVRSQQDKIDIEQDKLRVLEEEYEMCRDDSMNLIHEAEGIKERKAHLIDIEKEKTKL